MANLKPPLLSVVVPLYDEAAGLKGFHDDLLKTVKGLTDDYEIIYVDDGSSDNTAELIGRFHSADSRVKLIKLSRNFGKENALTAGIAAATGQATLMIDGDGQHPVEAIPEFVAKWRDGAKVVVGVHLGHGAAGRVKRTGSKQFYRLFNRLTSQQLIPGSSDFRLIDREVSRAFLELKEGNRMTRGLIDWLGFRRELVYFEPKPRTSGEAGYGHSDLMRLAANSFVSMSPKPLYFFGYLGVLITGMSLLAGTAIIIEQLVLNDPWSWNFTGTAMLGILIIFLVGLVLLSQGILSLYISHIHSQSKGRPLYVIDRGASAGIPDETRD
jgi:glycosyltransferase involved in cell wall biosynthesis